MGIAPRTRLATPLFTSIEYIRLVKFT